MGVIQSSFLNRLKKRSKEYDATNNLQKKGFRYLKILRHALFFFSCKVINWYWYIYHKQEKTETHSIPTFSSVAVVVVVVVCLCFSFSSLIN